VSDDERKLLAVPLWHSGLDLPNPRVTAINKYAKSTQIAAKLTEQIYNQEFDYYTMNNHHTKAIKSKLRQPKETTFRRCCDKIL